MVCLGAIHYDTKSEQAWYSMHADFLSFVYLKENIVIKISTGIK